MSPREDLAARQAALLGALVAGDAVPPGFDADRVAAEAGVLAAKRRRVLVRLVGEIVLDDDPDAVLPDPAVLDAHVARVAARPRRSGTGLGVEAREVVGTLRREGVLPRSRRRWWRRG